MIITRESIVELAAKAFDVFSNQSCFDDLGLRVFDISEGFIRNLHLCSAWNNSRSDERNLVTAISVGLVETSENEEKKRMACDGVSDFASILGTSFIEFFENGQHQLVWRSGSLAFAGHLSPIVFFAKRSTKCICTLYLSNAESLYRSLLFTNRNLSLHPQIFNLLICQLLNIFNECAAFFLFPIFSPRFISVDRNMWLSLDLPQILNCDSFPPNSFIHQPSTSKESSFRETHLWELTEAWCSRKLSNFDYLLKLNAFAGRVRYQPNNHPYLPWVCDFSSEAAGWRPLDRTKYRLNKGDAQLQETYRRQPAHHIPELLSDIGYYSYRARIESKETLCRHVRSKWVPEEYPRSMARMYEWTPDECVPEFYEDSSIFHSIHPDMCDIDLPPWCKTSDDFIRWHRSRLESDYVSSNLHKWIDLAFGYQLSGRAAVEALNVHLSYVHPDIIPVTHGVVQIFSTPHPERYVTVPKNWISPLETISFNPLYRSTSQHQSDHSSSSNDSLQIRDLLTRMDNAQIVDKNYQIRCLRSVAVTILEIALACQCRDLDETASFDDRLARSKRLLHSHSHLIPRHFVTPLKVLLLDDMTSSTYRSAVSMSSWLLNMFNLPSQVTVLHSSLQKYHALSCARHVINKIDLDLIDEEVSGFHRFLCSAGEEYLILLQQMLENILTDPLIAVSVLLHCIGPITQLFNLGHLSSLIPVIKQIYDSDAFYPSVLKIMDRRFLLQLSIAIGTKSFLTNIVPSLVESLTMDHGPSHVELIQDSIVWMAKRYGPIITTEHISSSLLRLLANCFADPRSNCPQLEEVDVDVVIEGDSAFSNIVHCLLEIASVFGSPLITIQYLPFCSELITQAIKRTTFASEASAVSAVMLLQHCCNSLSDRQLMDHIQESIMDVTIFPAVRFFSSASVLFSSLHMRRLFASRTLRTVHLLACRIGAENVSRYMSCAIQRLFCTFDLFYWIDGETIKRKETEHSQLNDLFSTSFAQLLFRLFSSVCGRPFLFETLPNAQLIFAICGSRSLPSASATFSLSSGNKLNTLTSYSASTFDPTSDISLNGKISSCAGAHMSENCAAHCRTVLSQTDDRIPLNQLVISTFADHCASVRRIVAMDNENSFASASLDRTVKLWSLKLSESYSVVEPQWSYQQHTRPVTDLCILPSLSVIASTDASLHIWDPFRGCAISQYDWPSVNDSSITNVSTYGRAVVVASSSLDNILRLVDVRQGRLCHSLYASEKNPSIKGVYSSSPVASIRCFAISPNENQCAVALTNGTLSILDMRTGNLVASSNRIHSDTLELRWISDRLLVSSHLDHPCICWSTSPLRISRRLLDSGSMLLIHREQLVTVQSSARLRIYEKLSPKSEVKLKSDLFPGSVSSVAYLPLNKMFLFGFSSGHIRLFC